jgi:hypothetical protein
MTRILTFVLSLGAMCAGYATPTLAQSTDVAGVSASADSQVRVGGSAPSVCRISAPSTLSATNAVFSNNANNGGQISVQQLTDPLTGVARASQISLSFDAVCNVSHAMIVRSRSGGLTRDAGIVAGSFSSRVDYRVDARWAGLSASQTFNGTPGTLAIPVEDGAIGALELDFSTSGGGAPLAAGRYSDAVVVELTAAS